MSLDSSCEPSPSSAQPGTVDFDSPWKPSLGELGSLGPVLCVWRGSMNSEFRCLQAGVLAKGFMAVSPDGVHEWIGFVTPAGQCCMRIHPLPIATDRRAWNRLLARLPAECSLPSLSGGCTRMLERMADWLRGEQWKACALSFMVPGASRRPAATLVTLGPVDAGAARNILALAGVDAARGIG